VLQGHPAIFFPNNSGHEPAMAYAHAATLKLFGWTAFSMRLPNAFFTTLAVAATFLLARRLFGWRVAWLAAFLEAVAFWQVAINRTATRSSMLILFGILVVYWLDRWLKGEHPWRSAALCGLFAGLAQYVYTPARFLAVVIAAMWLAAFVRAAKRRRLVAQGAAAAGIAAAVFAPLGWYFVHHPEDFSQRATQVSIFNPALGPVWQNALSALKVAFLMFGVDGEPGWDRDIAHQPMFDPILAVLFFAGILLALWRWRKPGYVLALTWLLAMMAPMVLTSPGWPDFGRAIGTAPAVFLFPAIAAAALWRRWPASQWLLGAGAAALVAVSSWQYFGIWAGARGTQFSYRPGVVAAGQSAVARLLAPDPPSAVYFGAPDDHDAVAAFITAGLDTQHPALGPRLIGYDARNTQVLPPAGAESYVLASDRPALTALPALANRLDVALQGALQVQGYDLPASIAPGQSLDFRVQWRPAGPSAMPVTLFAHLLDYSQQHVVASLDQNGFPAGEWRGGETVLSTFPLDVPAATPAGVYWLEFGAYTDGGRRLRTDRGDDRLLLGPVVIAGPTSPGQTPIAELGGRVGLLRSTVTQRGQALDVGLQWLPSQSLGQDYSVFVHVLDGTGRLVAQADGPPAGGQWPARYWLPGVPVDDARAVNLPGGLPAGRYAVAAGLYRLDTGERLQPATPAGPEPGSVLVGSVQLG
jgi:4-amino-4-deoxy-L-arabinose transferase-like glycosyltransferase